MEGSGLSQVAFAGIIFLIILFIFAILTVVLDHHWNSYEMDLKRRRRARRIYYQGSGVILVLMLISFVFFLI